MFAIEIKNLTQKFNEITAVDSISLEVKGGELFGLLGPNGAGKTTTISMLATILPPTSGSAFLNGFALDHPDEIRKIVGIIFQDPSLDDELTGRENLDFHGRIYHISCAIRKNRISEFLKSMNM